MSAKKHLVTLTEAQRAAVERAARSNKRSVRERLRARILGLADRASVQGGLKDAAIAAQTGASEVTVQRVRERFAGGGAGAGAGPWGAEEAQGAPAGRARGGPLGRTGVRGAPGRAPALEPAPVGGSARRVARG